MQSKASIFSLATVILLLTIAAGALGYFGFTHKLIEDSTVTIEGTVRSYTIGELEDGQSKITPKVEYQIEQNIYLADAPPIIVKKNPYADTTETYTVKVHYLKDNPGVLVDLNNKTSDKFFIATAGALSFPLILSIIGFVLCSRKRI